MGGMAKSVAEGEAEEGLGWILTSIHERNGILHGEAKRGKSVASMSARVAPLLTEACLHLSVHLYVFPRLNKKPRYMSVV